MAINIRYTDPALLGKIAIRGGRARANLAQQQAQQQQQAEQQALQQSLDFKAQQEDIDRQTKFALEAMRQTGQEQRAETGFERQMQLQQQRSELQLQNYQAKDELEQTRLKQKRQEYLTERDRVEKEFNEGNLNARQFDIAVQQLNEMPRYREVTELKIPSGPTREELEQEFDAQTVERDGVLFSRNRNGAWTKLYDGVDNKEKMFQKQQETEQKRIADMEKTRQKRLDDLYKREQKVEEAISDRAWEMVSDNAKLEGAEPLDYNVAFSRAREQYRALLSDIDMQKQALEQPSYEPTIGEMGGAQEITQEEIAAMQIADQLEALVQEGRTEEARQLLATIQGGR